MSAPVTVAVVSWNTRGLLAACLESLAPEAEVGRAAVWVVDNASSDGSAEMVAEEFPWVKLVALDSNVGFGSAVNIVAERTDSPWIAPANADIELTPGALEAMLDVGARDASVGVVAPQLVLPGGATQHSVHCFPTLGLFLLYNSGIPHLSRRLGDRLCVVGQWDANKGRAVDWAVGAFLLVRRAAFRAAGGFDPAQWMYAEDLDLGWRIARCGWGTRYEPSARVLHVESAATSQAFGERRVARSMAATYAWMTARHGPCRARAAAALNWIGPALRLAIFAPLGRVSARRFAGRRDRARFWVRVHQVGLARAGHSGQTGLRRTDRGRAGTARGCQ